MKIRKIVVTLEETLTEAEKVLERPARKAVAMAVIKNPYAGTYADDLSLLYDFGEKLGDLLTKKALEALGIKGDEAIHEIESYGKGAIVGDKGELEHTHALIHPKMGASIRAALGGPEHCKAIIPSTAKVASMGSTLDIPLHYKRALWVCSHWDAIEARISDSPRSDEMLVAVALTDSGRPLARIAGLQKQEAKGFDGLR
jgi:hypothetical protein